MLAVLGHDSVRSVKVAADSSNMPEAAMAEPSPVFLALEETPPPVEPVVVHAVESGESPEPVAVATPVQSLEERGDAMLFEIDALGGTPFDRAVTMPFDGFQ